MFAPVFMLAPLSLPPLLLIFVIAFLFVLVFIQMRDIQNHECLNNSANFA